MLTVITDAMGHSIAVIVYCMNFQTYKLSFQMIILNKTVYNILSFFVEVSFWLARFDLQAAMHSSL
jgi:hypothetical protein